MIASAAIFSLSTLSLALAGANATNFSEVRVILAPVEGEASGVRIDERVLLEAWGAFAILDQLRERLVKEGATLVTDEEIVTAQKGNGTPNLAPDALASVVEPLRADLFLRLFVLQKGRRHTAQVALIDLTTKEILYSTKSLPFRGVESARKAGTDLAEKLIVEMRRAVSAGRLHTYPLPPPPPVEPTPPPKTATVAAPPPPPPPPPPVEPTDDHDWIQIALRGGSTLLRSFAVSAAEVDRSSVSFSIGPLALLAGEAELIIPSVLLGLRGHVSLVPIRYRVRLQDDEQRPAGTIFDFGGALTWHRPVRGSGRTAWEVVPEVGVDVSRATVAAHLADVIHSTLAIIPYGALSFRLPASESFDTTLRARFGYVASFEERPTVDGITDGGFELGFNVAARLWFSDAVGIVLEPGFNLRRIALIGPSERQPGPPGETLTDVTQQTTDIEVSTGLCFRL